VPSGFFAMDLGRGWSAGFGISVPFGLKTEYTPTWLGRFQGISSEIKTVNYNPSVAYKLNDTLSLGAGIDYIQGEINFLTAVNLGVAETQNRTHVEGDAWGFNAGLIAKPTPRTNVGVHYRSTMKFNDLTGTTEFGLNAAPPLTSNGAVRLDNVRTPDSLALSVAQTLTNEVQLLGDVTWWHWSRINQLPLVRTDGPLAGTPQGTISTLNLDFKDTLRWSAGMKYKMSGVWTMKLGVAFDQSPVKDSSTRTVVLPDNDRWWATVGFKYVPSKNHAIDFGYAFVKVQDADINSNQAALGHGVVTGRYSAHVNTIGAQYQFSF
jgi:long-chain fatty acid transport protein